MDHPIPRGTSIDLSDKDAWDDSALIRAYDQAVVAYQEANGNGKVRSARATPQRTACEHSRHSSRAAATASPGLNDGNGHRRRSHTDSSADIEDDDDGCALDYEEENAHRNEGEEAECDDSVSEQVMAAQEIAAEEAAAAEEAEAEAMEAAEAEAAEEARRLQWAQWYAWQEYYHAAPPTQPAAAMQRASAPWTAPSRASRTSGSHPPQPPSSPHPNLPFMMPPGQPAPQHLPSGYHPHHSSESGMHASSSQTADYDTDMSNLIMAWYHCGFFTARFQERHRP